MTSLFPLALARAMSILNLMTTTNTTCGNKPSNMSDREYVLRETIATYEGMINQHDSRGEFRSERCIDLRNRRSELVYELVQLKASEGR